MSISYFHLTVDLEKTVVVNGDLRIPAIDTPTGNKFVIVYPSSSLSSKPSRVVRPSHHQGWNFGSYKAVTKKHTSGKTYKSFECDGDVCFIEPDNIPSTPQEILKDLVPSHSSIDDFLNRNEDLFLAYEELVVDYNTTKATEAPFYRFDYNSVYSDQIISANVRNNLLKAMIDNSVRVPNILPKTSNWVESYDAVRPAFDEADINTMTVDFADSMWTTLIYFEMNKDEPSIDNVLKLCVEFSPYKSASGIPYRRFDFVSGASWQSQRQEMLTFWQTVANNSLFNMERNFTMSKNYYDMLLSKYIDHEYRG